MPLIPLLFRQLPASWREEIGEAKNVVSNSYPLHWLRPNSYCAPRHHTPPFPACFPLVGWSDRHGFRGNEVGSLQPNSVPFRGHLDHSLVRNLFSFGHLLDREGEREGDGQGALCLSCTRHLAALQIARLFEIV